MISRFAFKIAALLIVYTCLGVNVSFCGESNSSVKHKLLSNPLFVGQVNHADTAIQACVITAYNEISDKIIDNSETISIPESTDWQESGICSLQEVTVSASASNIPTKIAEAHANVVVCAMSKAESSKTDNTSEEKNANASRNQALANAVRSYRISAISAIPITVAKLAPAVSCNTSAALNLNTATSRTAVEYLSATIITSNENIIKLISMSVLVSTLLNSIAPSEENDQALNYDDFAQRIDKVQNAYFYNLHRLTNIFASIRLHNYASKITAKGAIDESNTDLSSSCFYEFLICLCLFILHIRNRTKNQSQKYF